MKTLSFYLSCLFIFVSFNAMSNPFIKPVERFTVEDLKPVNDMTCDMDALLAEFDGELGDATFNSMAKKEVEKNVLSDYERAHQQWTLYNQYRTEEFSKKHPDKDPALAYETAKDEQDDPNAEVVFIGEMDGERIYFDKATERYLYENTQ